MSDETLTDCDACLSGNHRACVGTGCACFERTCDEAERAGRALDDEGEQ